MGAGGIGGADGTLGEDNTRSDAAKQLLGDPSYVPHPEMTEAQIWGQSSFGGNAPHQDEDGNYVPGSAQTAAHDYEQRGATYNNRAAPELNYGAANQSLAGATSQVDMSNRSLGGAAGSFDQAGQATGQANYDRGLASQARTQQQEALGLQQSAANGGQPSQAQILGQNQLSQGFHQQLAAGASSAGGPLAQMSAQRQAMNGAAAQNQQGANSIAALRAQEMAQARGEYQQGASGIRAGDTASGNQAIAMGQGYANIGAQQVGAANASTNAANTRLGIGTQQAGQTNAAAQNEMNQRQLNDRGQQFYADKAYNTQNDEANRGVQLNAQREQSREADQTDHAKTVDRNTGIVKDVAKGMGSMLEMFSDERTKDMKDDEPSTGSKAATGIGRAIQVGAGGTVEKKEEKKPEAPKTPPPKTAQAPMAAPPKARSPQAAMLANKPIAQQSPDQGQVPAWLEAEQQKQDPSFLDAPANRPNAPAPKSYGGMFHQDGYSPQEIDNVNYANAQNAPPPMGGSDDPYSSGTPGGIQREDPYGSGQMFYSDATVKKQVAADAFQQGMQYGAAKSRPGGPVTMGDAAVSENGRRNPADKAIKVANNEAADEDRQAASGAAMGISATGGVPWGTVPAAIDMGMHSAAGAGARDRAERLVSERDAPPPPAQTRSPFTEQSSEDARRTPLFTPGPRTYSSDDRTKSKESLEQDANRKMEGTPWSYKDSFRGDDEPGQLHYGTTTQKLEQNPITATAVRKDPKTGLGTVNMPALLQAQGAGIASLQKQVDQLKR